MNKTKYQVPVLAWASMLLFSILPDVLYRELIGGDTQWLLVGKIVLLTALLWLTLFWEPARRLRSFFLIFVALFIAEQTFHQVSQWAQWQAWFSGQGFLRELIGDQLLGLGVTGLMIVALLGLGFKRREAFLRRGWLAAPSKPMPLFGFDKESSWKKLGLALTLYIGGAMAIVMYLLSRPTAAQFQALLPLLPWIVVLAMVNSFTEEISYRAALLAPLHKLFNGGQAILITAAYFGISHYYGVPYGIIGVLLSAFFGWVLGRAMVETEGLFWPWLIHLGTDIVIFSFMAMGMVTAGGV